MDSNASHNSSTPGNVPAPTKNKGKTAKDAFDYNLMYGVSNEAAPDVSGRQRRSKSGSISTMASGSSTSSRMSNRSSVLTKIITTTSEDELDANDNDLGWTPFDERKQRMKASLNSRMKSVHLNWGALATPKGRKLILSRGRGQEADKDQSIDQDQGRGLSWDQSCGGCSDRCQCQCQQWSTEGQFEPGPFSGWDGGRPLPPHKLNHLPDSEDLAPQLRDYIAAFELNGVTDTNTIEQNKSAGPRRSKNPRSSNKSVVPYMTGSAYKYS